MTTLKLDYDGALPFNIAARIIARCALWRWPLAAVRFDRTAHGWHVLVDVRGRIAPPYIVAAQAILGSDAKREAFNLMRVRQLRQLPAFWRSRWNVLYTVHRRRVSLARRAPRRHLRPPTP
jgi:hypothetical protein